MTKISHKNLFVNKVAQFLKGNPASYRFVRDRYIACKRVAGACQLKWDLTTRKPWKIVIGSHGYFEKGWIPTEKYFLDLLKQDDWDRYFPPDSIAAMLAESVWEYLITEDAVVAAKMCFKYLKPDGYLRIGVPDGLHPDPNYIKAVGIGTWGGVKIVYTYKMLRKIFETAGFDVVFYEYFNEQGRFCSIDWDPEYGMVYRSKRFDSRNKDGRLNHTSIILDARKPQKI